jgi:hypothetical protein
VSSRNGSIQDLQALNSGQNGLQNVIGAVQTASAVYNTFSNVDPLSIIQPALQNDAISQALQSLPDATRTAVNSLSGMIFPAAKINTESYNTPITQTELTTLSTQAANNLAAGGPP